jgi:hypothetical protein
MLCVSELVNRERQGMIGGVYSRCRCSSQLVSGELSYSRSEHAMQ